MPEGKTVTLSEARRTAGLTLVELARLSGVTPGQIANIERGWTPGDLITRHRLSDALQVPFRLMWPDSMATYQELMGRMKEGPDMVAQKTKPENQGPNGKV